MGRFKDPSVFAPSLWKNAKEIFSKIYRILKNHLGLLYFESGWLRCNMLNFRAISPQKGGKYGWPLKYGTRMAIFGKNFPKSGLFMGFPINNFPKSPKSGLFMGFPINNFPKSGIIDYLWDFP